MSWSWSTAALVFVSYAVLDALYAVYTLAVQRLQPGRATVSAAVLYALSAYGLRTYVENGWYVVPLVLGASLGTYLTVAAMRFRALKG